MAGTRLQVDFYFDKMTPKQVNSAYPQLLTIIKVAKAKASKINEGSDNEEMTVKARYHICGHQDGTPCTDWVEI